MDLNARVRTKPVLINDVDEDVAGSFPIDVHVPIVTTSGAATVGTTLAAP